jgi:hypothetical protein
VDICIFRMMVYALNDWTVENADGKSMLSVGADLIFKSNKVNAVMPVVLPMVVKNSQLPVIVVGAVSAVAVSIYIYFKTINTFVT